MSGALDDEVQVEAADPENRVRPVPELIPARSTELAGVPIRRLLPRRARRTVGAWCFLDHIGPLATDRQRFAVGPHPHIGLQTVTWLVAGEFVHRDSLGNEEIIRPGQLNLMTAGSGIVHAEEEVDAYRDLVLGAQLWVAQPEATRHGAASFEHHVDLPFVELATGRATVLVGSLEGELSPSRHDTALVGVDLDLGPGRSSLPLERAFEHAIVVLSGRINVADVVVEPGNLCYLGTGRAQVELDAAEPTRALLLGGVPFEEELVMWWNFVARSRDEITAAYEDWQRGSDRFGATSSPLPRVAVGPPAWLGG